MISIILLCIKYQFLKLQIITLFFIYTFTRLKKKLRF